jgi:hypothetical protein
MANRISYFFNMHGPSVTVDTGCSGSLVAVHLGAQSLRTKESSLVSLGFFTFCVKCLAPMLTIAGHRCGRGDDPDSEYNHANDGIELPEP